MHQAQRGPGRQPIHANPQFNPPRILTDAAPAPVAAPLEVNAGERRVWFEGGGGIELQYPARLVWPSPWIGHIPFALWLVEALRPRVVVELGVHSGNSYCAFLQAVQSLSLAAQCYGIDHWRGDDHAEHYGEEVYADLCSYHEPLYGTFSTLIRATFEEALPYFADSSIDLLHIDGFHTYEAVAKDFSEWLPKMSARGVVLFHDINVREREFGVWRFWEEVAARYPTLAFVHSHGLGLAYVGTDQAPDPLRTLLAPSGADSISRIRVYFARLGASLVDRFGRRQAEGIAGRVRASEADLQAARAEISRHAESVDAVRIEAGKAQAQVAVLQEELAAARAEGSRQIDAAGRLQQELAATRAEATRQTEEATRQAEEAARQAEEAARQAEEAARQAEAASALRQECSEARSALARLTEAATLSQTDARNATDRIALLEDELATARAEIAQQLEAANVSRSTTEDMTLQVAALRDELLRARDEISQAVGQRERATQLLRQQITTTLGLQRELAATRAARPLEGANGSRATTGHGSALVEQLFRARGEMSEAIAERDKATQRLQQEVTVTGGLQRQLAALRQTDAVAALVTRLAPVKRLIPRPIKRYIRNRLVGLRP